MVKVYPCHKAVVHYDQKNGGVTITVLIINSISVDSLHSKSSDVALLYPFSV